MVTRSILRPVLRPVTRAVSDTIRGFNPRSLFAAGEQGIWLDPSDFSTLFQDSAGTTPVTAVGQPVGKILDKSGRGNHASQTTSASRPTVEARVNLATNSEGAAATWTVSSVVDASTPIAGFSASLQFGDNSVERTGYKFINLTAGVTYSASFFVQMDDGSVPVIGASTNAASDMQIVVAGATLVSATVQHISGSVYRISASSTAAASMSLASGARKRTGQSAKGFRVIGIQVEEGTTATTYQRVNTATDYVDVGAPRYLQLDGTDDGMATPSIDFTGTDKMTVWTGVRKLSDAAAGIICELSADRTANNGAFSLVSSGAPSFLFASKGTLDSTNTVTGNASPISRVLTGIGDIAGDKADLRVNGSATPATTDQGTGNYGNYPLYIGRRAGASLPFNGRIYQLIIRGAESNAGQIAAGEAWCNSKTRAYA